MPCVLLVEDEALIAVEMADVLEGHGCRVEISRSGEDALRRLRDGLNADILFTDINLAGAMDGATLARIARGLHPELIVVYTSGTVDAVAEPVPGSAFVPKPYSPKSVCALLTRIAAVAA
jgi:CheY-like chemotaxis protein